TAAKLFKMTERGTTVIVSNDAVAPVSLSHPFLPGAPRQQPTNESVFQSLPLRPALGSDAVEVASLDPTITQSVDQSSVNEAPARKNHEPLKIRITWKSDQDNIKLAQEQLNYLGFDAGKTDGIIGR